LASFLTVFSQDADDELDRKLYKAVKAGCFKVYRPTHLNSNELQ
jgi:hypothetical protein